MQWPTLIVDDFFTDPHRVVKLSKTFKYMRASDNTWPGTRTPPMNEVDKVFLQWSTRKIMAILYPMYVDGLRWKAVQYFQRVPYEIHGEEGWVHHDGPTDITSIVYLRNHSNSGTCLYKGKHFNMDVEYDHEKERFYKDLKDRNRMEKYKDKWNSKFSKNVELFSNFNRLVLFDGYNWHASRNSGDDKSERLTLITSFTNITGKDIRHPLTEMRRI